MEITNLSPQPNNLPKKAPLVSIYMILIVVALATALGFWVSRFQSTEDNNSFFSDKKDIVSIEEIDNASEIEIGKVYGNNGKIYKDNATGIIQKGNINGVGTHILKREGGDGQTVSLTSSSVDLDLFIDRKVEIQGETNASDKTSWLVDVGMVTVLE
jgi:hypothetical protein